jgi:predicted permease
MRTLWQDLRFGWRLLLNSPGFTAVAVLTLALGIAANTTVFSWVDSLLLRPFPGARDSHQLAVLEMITAGAPNGANQVSYLDYLDYRRSLSSPSHLAVHREEVFTVGDTGAAQAVWGELVSGNYFETLGVAPALGRVFSREEDGGELGAYPVVVISHGLWRRRFQADAGAVGKTLRINQRELTVIGVAPPEFRGTMPGLAFDLWIPVTMGKDLGILTESSFTSRGSRGLYAVARLRPGVDLTRARAEAASFAHRLEAAFPLTNRGVSATVLPVWEFHAAAPGLLLKPLRILMAFAALVLLIVCANVANLLLARAAARRKELALRLALGASHARVGRQLLTETMLLAVGGAAAGFLLAGEMANLLPALIPRVNAPIALGFQVSERVMLFVVLICVLTTLIAGGVPLAWLRSGVNAAINEGGRSGSQGARSHRMRAILVVSEVALATVTLIGAALLVRSFRNARDISPGFERSHVLLARFYLGGAGFSTPAMQQFAVRLRDRLRSSPGIADAAYANYAPLGSSAGPYIAVEVEGYVPALGESTNINNSLVAPGYFNVLRMPLIEGRDFSERDAPGSAPVIIVNESFARRYFHGTSVIGRKVRCFGQWATVVGLIKDSKFFNIAEAPRPHLFAPFAQRGRSGSGQQLFFFIKTYSDPKSIAEGMRREAAAIDPAASAFDVMPLIEWTEVTLLPQKVAASLLAALGLMALILAAVGLYSVMAYAVAQRTQEIGIRMALGAPPQSVLGSVLWRGSLLTTAGLAAGIAASLAAARLLDGMLIDIGATDASTFLGTALFLLLVALVASYLPARRATRIDPMIALRCD